MKTKILSPLRRDGYKAGMIMMLIALSAMLLTTACSSEDDLVNNTANTENTINKGYALPVTVNVTRQGDATTRATYNESTKKLEFSDGDKLFVYGSATTAGSFAGTLDYVSEGTFSGTIYTEKEWTGTADALFTAASTGENLTATLLPNGYDANGSNSFLFVYDNGTPACSYDDTVIADGSHAFVASETAKATGVEQLSYELATTYSSGFALAPVSAILNFTISGLEAGAQDVTLYVRRMGADYTVTGSVTPNAGVATFAIGVPVGANISSEENNLTVGSSNFTLPSNIEFDKGKIYNIARNAIPGALIGQFSVGMDGSTPIKVYFSKGNLQATYNGSTWTWAFAEHQYDYIGNAEGNTKVSVSDPFVTDYTGSSTTVDLFGWSTSTTYLGIHKSRDDGDYSGGFFNWGSHEDVKAGIGEGWRTLSKEEWLHLFNQRSGSTVNGTENGRYAKAKVNGVWGVILFPDSYTHPDGVTAPTNVNTANASFDSNTYTNGDWTKMESAGCVFLPAAGYRDEADVIVAGSDGYYWSSSANGDDEAYYVYFAESDDLPEVTYTSRYNGHSVRLVRPVQ